MSNESTPQRLTTREVSAYFEGKISEKTLNNWRSQGRGPKFLRIEGKVLYPIDELKKWEEQNLYSSTSNYRAAT